MNKVAQVALVFVIMDESMRVLGWGLPWYFLGEVTCENWKETQSVPTRCSSRTLPRRACTLCSNKCAREFVMALRPMFTAFAWFQFASQRATQMALEFLWTWTCMLPCCASMGLQCKRKPEFSTFRSYPDYKISHKCQILLHSKYKRRWQVMKQL